MVKRSLVLILFFATVIAGCTVGPPQTTSGKADENEKEAGIVRKKDKIVLSGNVYPVREAEVTSPLSGEIARINVKVDDYVQEGTPLLYFNTTSLNADLRAARSRLAKSRADLESSKGTDRREVYRREINRGISDREAKIRVEETRIVFENTRRKLERMKEAHGDNAVSKQELEGVENEHARADADLKVALLRAKGLPLEETSIVRSYQSEVMTNEAEYTRAEDRLRQATVNAPISGFIADIAAYPGQKVYDGWDLLKIVDISRVKVEAKISPGLLKFVHPDQEVEVTINTVPQTKVKARINSVSKLADPEDQMCRVRTILENKDFAFQPGFTAKIEIATERGE